MQEISRNNERLGQSKMTKVILQSLERFNIDLSKKSDFGLSCRIVDECSKVTNRIELTESSRTSMDKGVIWNQLASMDAMSTDLGVKSFMITITSLESEYEIGNRTERVLTMWKDILSFEEKVLTKTYSVLDDPSMLISAFECHTATKVKISPRTPEMLKYRENLSEISQQTFDVLTQKQVEKVMRRYPQARSTITSKIILDVLTPGHRASAEKKLQLSAPEYPSKPHVHLFLAWKGITKIPSMTRTILQSIISIDESYFFEINVGSPAKKKHYSFFSGAKYTLKNHAYVESSVMIDYLRFKGATKRQRHTLIYFSDWNNISWRSAWERFFEVTKLRCSTNFECKDFLDIPVETSATSSQGKSFTFTDVCTYITDSMKEQNITFLNGVQLEKVPESRRTYIQTDESLSMKVWYSELIRKAQDPGLQKALDRWERHSLNLIKVGKLNSIRTTKDSMWVEFQDCFFEMSTCRCFPDQTEDISYAYCPLNIRSMTWNELNNFMERDIWFQIQRINFTGVNFTVKNLMLLIYRLFLPGGADHPLWLYGGTGTGKTSTALIYTYIFPKCIQGGYSGNMGKFERSYFNDKRIGLIDEIESGHSATSFKQIGQDSSVPRMDNQKHKDITTTTSKVPLIITGQNHPSETLQWNKPEDIYAIMRRYLLIHYTLRSNEMFDNKMIECTALLVLICCSTEYSRIVLQRKSPIETDVPIFSFINKKIASIKDMDSEHIRDRKIGLGKMKLPDEPKEEKEKFPSDVGEFIKLFYVDGPKSEEFKRMKIEHDEYMAKKAVEDFKYLVSRTFRFQVFNE